MSATVKTKPVKTKPVKTKPVKTRREKTGPEKAAPSRNLTIRTGTVRKQTRGNDILVVGGQPRVHLLPPEVRARKRGRELRRRLGFGLIAVVVIVAAAAALATLSMLSAQNTLNGEQNRASTMLAQQAKYADVTKVQADVAAIKNAQVLGTAREISWTPYIQQLQATLTPGMSITSLDASLDPITASTPTVVPLQGPRIATLDVTIASPQAPISNWLDSLKSLTGFVDATPGSVTLNQGTYKVDVVIHINDKALANRFATKKK